MKKLIAFIVSLCIIGGSAPAALEYAADYALTASAADIVESGSCGENLTWTLDSEGTLTISGTGDMTNYDVNGAPFYENSNIKAIKIENGVTSIGDWAFYYCTSLESITIPDSVTSIGGSAFYYCTSLTSITIPDSVTSIGVHAFYNCASLESITIPDSVTSIDDEAFGDCKSLASITILNSDCEINDLSNTIYNGFNYDIGSYYFYGTIYSYLGSTAQAYADKYGYKFSDLAPNGELLGNVNGDTSVDSSDAALVLSHYAQFQSDGAGKFTEAQLAVADYNSDSNIDSSDAALILRAYAENQSK